MIQKIEKGMTLIAMPSLLDSNFRQTVILLCEHGPEGSMGLVINRPTEVEVSALVDDFPALVRSGKVYSGGPISRNAMLVLCHSDEIQNGHGVLQDVFLARDLEVFKNQEWGTSKQEVRCYLGYAGWGPGQLEAEMQSRAWELIPGDSRLIFETDLVLLWQAMMKRMGGDCAAYSSMPPDPTAN